MTGKRKRVIEACVPEQGQNPFRKLKMGKSDGTHSDVNSGANATSSRHANFHSMPSSTTGTGNVLPLSFPPERLRFTGHSIPDPPFALDVFPLCDRDADVASKQVSNARVVLPRTIGSADIPNRYRDVHPPSKQPKLTKIQRKLRSHAQKGTNHERPTKKVIVAALNRLAASQSPGLEIDENQRRDEVRNIRQADHNTAAQHRQGEEPALRSDPALEPSEEGSVFSAQHRTEPHNAHHENLSYGKQHEKEEMRKRGAGLKLQIILDTNVVIGHLDFIRRLLSSSHEDTELLIPKAVLTELDAFKTQHRETDVYIGRKSIKQDMWCAARDATNWLLQATQAHERVKLQNMGDEPKELRKSKDGDARILAYAIKVAHRALAQAKRVALFSNDNILRLNAKSEGILAYSINDVGDDPNRLLSAMTAPRVKKFDPITTPELVAHIEKGAPGANVGNSQSSHQLAPPKQSGSGISQSVVTEPLPNSNSEPLGNQIAIDEEVIIVMPHVNSGHTYVHNTEGALSANQLGKRKENNAPDPVSPRTSDPTDTTLISEDFDFLDGRPIESPNDMSSLSESENCSLNWLTREIPSEELDAFIGQPAAAPSPSFVPDIHSAKQALNNILENLSQFFKKHPYRDPAEQHARAELTRSVIEQGRLVMSAITPPTKESVVQNTSS
ncbi:uncharacterized protein MELLADRAFT_88147 [Melampsora larici-populina 98AG31]|uniref:PIN domain-containing protein n=1 Tax=Melampsora larici-populina (strain 98AG31 / pathotype 3-4-7) TaxID=747676 RepID=F4RQR0_MELLP|nr:uncharacterized protein MELLADRAFT_88147 [Melampsora larici-populina 98AG31]EGG05079.1 hypothetical protein MELLADRAFT_88147 [Melampsora larici-populina 98AG31]